MGTYLLVRVNPTQKQRDMLWNGQQVSWEYVSWSEGRPKGGNCSGLLLQTVSQEEEGDNATFKQPHNNRSWISWRTLTT